MRIVKVYDLATDKSLLVKEQTGRSGIYAIYDSLVVDNMLVPQLILVRVFLKITFQNFIYPVMFLLLLFVQPC